MPVTPQFKNETYQTTKQIKIKQQVSHISIKELTKGRTFLLSVAHPVKFEWQPAGIRANCL